MSDQADADQQIEIFKIKRMIKSLEKARGEGTSMISLIIPPKDQIPRVNKMLQDEHGTASHIKSRVNRISVQGAIVATLSRLKTYNKVPENGLVVYCGTVKTDEGKEKKINISFNPFKPINTSLYMCDNKFHTEALQSLLTDDNTFGFIVMDGNGALFGTLQGNARTVLHKFSVALPKKHGRGGQSAMRFGRLRLEKRHNYVRKVAEHAVQMFITNDKVNVEGLILAGSADFKSDLAKADLFDQRLATKILKKVDVGYGGEKGFGEAIELAAECLGNVKFVAEKKLIKEYFDEISVDSNKYCYGMEDTMRALEMGACETLIVWENLDLTRYELRDGTDADIETIIVGPEQLKTKSFLINSETGNEKDIVSSEPIVEWIVNSYTKFGTSLEIVTDKSEEGNQFVKGFGGIGGLLRYAVNFAEFHVEEEYEEDGWDYDDIM